MLIAAALGIPQQKTLFEAAFKVVKKATQPQKLKVRFYPAIIKALLA